MTDLEKPGQGSAPQVTLYALLARAAPVGVIFRRGPSKRVLLIKWDTKSDTFLEGQWFKGRIHEWDCDLSPCGDMLLYFATKYKGPFHTWTALSRPPWLTALALWPLGDTWYGGGLFLDGKTVYQNHPEGRTELAEGFSLPRRMKVQTPAQGAEYCPTATSRLLRDGWVRKRRAGREVYEKSFCFDASCIRSLRRDWSGRAFGETEHESLDGGGQSSVPLGRTEWADWDRKGDILFARGGKLFRLKPDKKKMFHAENAVELADFSDLRFTERAAPDWALRW